MTPRVWIERPIESVEDAEALPEGTVVLMEDKDGPWEKRPDGKFQGAGRVIVDAYRVLDRTALVPVEAVEEMCSIGTRGASEDEWRRRLVTPWAYVTPPRQ